MRLKLAALSTPLPLIVPLEVTLPTVSLPLSVKVAPRATVTAALSDSRLALPNVNRPLCTPTVPALAVPLSVLVPVEVRVPAPKLASAVPPVSA